jgi:hypothetical protein
MVTQWGQSVKRHGAGKVLETALTQEVSSHPKQTQAQKLPPTILTKIKQMVLIYYSHSTLLFLTAERNSRTFRSGLSATVTNKQQPLYRGDLKMKMIEDAMGSVGNILRSTISLGMAIAVAFLIVDILFGAQTNIVANLTTVIKSFVTQGVVGLIALIVFISMFNRS